MSNTTKLTQYELFGCATCRASAAALRLGREDHGSPAHRLALQAWSRFRTADGRTLHTEGCPENAQFSLVFGVEVSR
jgi:hypothetical protein